MYKKYNAMMQPPKYVSSDDRKRCLFGKDSTAQHSTAQHLRLEKMGLG
jgi:hypothetical protein